MRKQFARPRPALDLVEEAVRKALYNTDPLERASAEAQLALWGLPASPSALRYAAERLYAPQPA
jgi:hypothetical protein